MISSSLHVFNALKARNHRFLAKAAQAQKFSSRSLSSWSWISPGPLYGPFPRAVEHCLRTDPLKHYSWYSASYLQ